MTKRHNHLNLFSIFKSIVKNKIIIISITLIFTFLQYYNYKYNKEPDVYNMGTAALIKKTYKNYLTSFINTNLIFFKSLNMQDLEMIVQTQSSIYEEILFTNFISLDNFIIFLKNTGNLNLLNELTNKKKSSNDVFIKNLGIFKRSNQNFVLDSDLKELGNIYIPKNSEVTYLKHKSNIDGRRILFEYLNFVKKQANDLYLKQKKYEFNLVLQRYIEGRDIAKRLKIKSPLSVSDFYESGKSADLIDFHKFVVESIQNVSGTSIYLKGTDIIEFELEIMEKKINELDNLNFDFNLILDSPFIFYKEKKVIKDLYSLSIEFLLKGFLVSLIIVFLKSFFLVKKKVKKKI